jgi:fucose 4-O-acetylase-like acetyltransferase
MKVEKARLDAFDILKGIAILLVVLGHSLPSSKIGDLISNFIYSFHMPLFFIVSGYFYKTRPLLEQIKKDIFGLLLPYIIFCIVLTIYGLFRDLYGGISFPHETTRWFRICFYGSYNPNVPLGYVGPIWFLLAMFWCKTMFSFLFSNNTKRNVVSFIFFPIFIAYMFKYIYIPLYVLQGITAMVFYYIGYLVKENDLLNRKCPIYIKLAMIIIWGYCIRFSHIGMHGGYYDNIIINIIGAVSGTYFMYIISRYIESKMGLIRHFFKYAGKYSLVILCFHSLDYSIWDDISWYMPVISKIQSLFTFTQGHFYRYYISLRFIYVFIVLLFIPRIPIIRRYIGV